MSCPLYLTLALTPPPLFFLLLLLIIFFFFCFFKNLLRLKINILSSVYPEINFPAEHVMKINNLSRPKVPPPPSESNGRPLTCIILQDANFAVQDYDVSFCVLGRSQTLISMYSNTVQVMCWLSIR